MSSDMFSSLVEKGVGLPGVEVEEQASSYKELEFSKWFKFRIKCKLRRYSKCITTDNPCFIDNCHQWQLYNFIKFGTL